VKRGRSVIGASRGRGGVNVTPMIDVVMCLIVFYLMVGQLAMARRAGVELPPAEHGVEQSLETDAIVVTLAMDGAVALGADPIDPDRLEGELRGRLARDPEALVRVRADGRAAAGDLRGVLRAVEDAGARRVDLATTREGGF